MMTNEEVLEKYGDTQVQFTSYYKYTFSFDGVATDGAEISAGYGGNADDIYKFDVSREPQRLGDPRDWFCLTIKKDGEKIFDYMDI